VNREAVKISSVIIPRSWRDAAFGKYAHSHVREVEEPEDEPQADLAERNKVERG